ncbi:MAG: hypothetical protein M3P08_18170 [Thermoproteota archaeon]|nr:hypothetical protein [Thermoproteota archaeon]MDQ6667712.1 hypothetical protein [Thermoproteota archaeon]
MNHTTLAIVIVLTAALVTGASLAIPLQDAKASSNHHKKQGNSVNIKNNENQANACTGALAYCVNLLRNVDCVHSICIIGDISPWVMATPH